MARQKKSTNSTRNMFADDLEKIDWDLRRNLCACKGGEKISTGDSDFKCIAAVEKIRKLEPPKSLTEDLGIYRNKMGDSLAHTLVTHHNEPKALTGLLDLSPNLAKEKRMGHMKGQTILHIAICRKNIPMVSDLLLHLTNGKEKLMLLREVASASRFKYTVMMGQLPLSVAALTFEKEMVTLLFEHGADISWKNSDGENVFHSLVHYAAVHLDLVNLIVDMMQYLHEKMCQPYLTCIKRPATPYILHCTNRFNMTPLQLAASLGQADLFKAILNLSNTYRLSKEKNSPFGDVLWYDITEIDMVSQAEWERYPPDSASQLNQVRKSWNDPGYWPAFSHRSQSALELISQLEANTAYLFLRIDAVHALVKDKWEKYKCFLILYGFIHFIMMVIITLYAVYKTDVINSNMYPDRPANQREKNFSIAAAALGLIYAVILLSLEMLRIFILKDRVPHNVNYRVMLGTFSLSLVVDTIWFFVNPSKNYFLIIALIFGWSFMGFFLRTIRRFSFYTVMFLEILSGDMVKIGILIFCQFIAFSVALYSTFLNADSNDGFENFYRAAISSFNLMLGLADVQILNDAREPWMAIVLYVGFILSTYVLLLNSLIALMAFLCETITEQRNQHFELQRLLVMLMLEAYIPKPCRFLPKKVDPVRRYGKPVQEFRSYTMVKNAPSTKDVPT